MQKKREFVVEKLESKNQSRFHKCSVPIPLFEFQVPYILNIIIEERGQVRKKNKV